MSVSFEEKLIELRKSRIEPPKTQTEVGVYLGLGLRQYQRYEDGEAIPDIERLIKLSELLEYDFISHITNERCVILDMYRKQKPQLPPGVKELMGAIHEGFNSSVLVKTLEEVREALTGFSLALTKAKDIETFQVDQKKGKNASEHT